MYRIVKMHFLEKQKHCFFPLLDSILLTNEHKLKKVENCWHKNKFLYLKIVVVVVVVVVIESFQSLDCQQNKTSSLRTLQKI
jgi:hypothetical protein